MQGITLSPEAVLLSWPPTTLILNPAELRHQLQHSQHRSKEWQGVTRTTCQSKCSSLTRKCYCQYRYSFGLMPSKVQQGFRLIWEVTPAQQYWSLVTDCWCTVLAGTYGWRLPYMLTSLKGPQLKLFYIKIYWKQNHPGIPYLPYKNCQLANGDKPKRLSILSRKWSAHRSLRSALGSHLPILTARMKKGAGKEQDFRICKCSLASLFAG